MKRLYAYDGREGTEVFAEEWFKKHCAKADFDITFLVDAKNLRGQNYMLIDANGRKLAMFEIDTFKYGHRLLEIR